MAKRRKTKSGKQKELECILCRKRYSLDDILKGAYRLETMVCSFCYASLQKQPYDISCFGKPTVILPNNQKLLGYSPKAPECQRFCPDRKVCALVMDPGPGKV